jgi:hypothetical protein
LFFAFAFVFCPLVFLFASGCTEEPPEGAGVSLAEGASISLAVVRAHGKWGYIDTSGREVIPPRFDKAESFTANGLARFRKGQKWGYIDVRGRKVIPPRFDEAGYFAANGLAEVKVDGKRGYIDASGKEVIPLRFENAVSFSPHMSKPPLR